MITINMTHVSLAIQNLHAPASSLEGVDIELNLDDCEIEIGELSIAESIQSNVTESFDPDFDPGDPCYHNKEAPEEDPRSVAQATADGVGERLIYPH